MWTVSFSIYIISVIQYYIFTKGKSINFSECQSENENN